MSNACTDQELINSFQRLAWTMKTKPQKIFIVLVNCFTIFPGILYFLNKVYGSDDPNSAWAITVLIIAQIIIPLIAASIQVYQGLIISFKLAKTSLVSIIISSFFYLLSLSPKITENFKKAFPNKSSGIFVCITSAISLLFLYIIGFSEINYSKKTQTSTHCSIRMSKMV